MSRITQIRTLVRNGLYYLTEHAVERRKVRGQCVLIENVPAGVCTQCGTRYYAANVLKTIEESLRGRRQPKREVLVSVYSL